MANSLSIQTSHSYKRSARKTKPQDEAHRTTVAAEDTAQGTQARGLRAQPKLLGCEDATPTCKDLEAQHSSWSGSARSPQMQRMSGASLWHARLVNSGQQLRGTVRKAPVYVWCCGCCYCFVFVALCASLLQPRNAFLNFPVLETLFYYGPLLP